MTTELVNKTTGEIIEQKGFTDEQIQLLKSTVCKDHTNEEFAVFLNVCNRVQLDPFAKQIYSIKYNGRMTTQTSIDGLRLIADRTGRYAPGKAPTFTYDKDGKLESATAYIMKKVGNEWFEVGSTAIMREYENQYNQLWKKLPHAMLAKCAEATALRRAFPNETSGLYSTEEMSTAGESKPTIQMPRAKTIIQGVDERIERNRTSDSRSNDVEGIDRRIQQVSEAELSSSSRLGDESLLEDNTDNGLENTPIEFGEPSEKEKIEEKVKQAFGNKNKPITEKQRKFLWAKCKQANVPENILRAYLKDNFSLEHTDELTMAQLDKLVVWVDKYASVNETKN